MMFWIYYGAVLLLLGGPLLVIVLWDVCVTEPRQERRRGREM